MRARVSPALGLQGTKMRKREFSCENCKNKFSDTPGIDGLKIGDVDPISGDIRHLKDVPPNKCPRCGFEKVTLLPDSPQPPSSQELT